jgi:hypothetical protein
MRFYRFATPGLLLITGILFFLPWVERRKETHSEGAVLFTATLESSGWQLGVAAIAGQADPNFRHVSFRLIDGGMKEELEPAFLLAAGYGLTILFGIVVTAFPSSSIQRAIITGTLMFVMLLLLGLIRYYALTSWPEIDGPPVRTTGAMFGSGDRSFKEVTFFSQGSFYFWYWLSFVPLILCLGFCLMELRRARLQATSP